MIHQQCDRRVTQSKRMIKSAFLSLLKTNSLDKISVRMIIDKADVNRGTFYNHYKDKEIFVDELIQNEMQQMKSIYESLRNDPDFTMYVFYKELLGYIGSEHELYSGIIHSELKLRYCEETIKCLVAIHEDVFKEQDKSKNDFIIIKSVVYSNVIHGVILNWAKEDFNFRPEYLIKLVRNVLDREL